MGVSLRARERSRMTVLFMAVAATLVATGGVAFGQSDSDGQPSPPTAVEAARPAWRDLERAQDDLELALQARDSVQMAIDRTED